MLNKPATMDTTDTTMEDLLAKTTNLTVLDEDGWEINLAGRSEVESFCAMGRLCSNRPMNRPLLKTILGRIWGISEKDWGVEIKFSSKESSFLVFSFKSSQDLNRIINKNPWFLNNGFLIVERFNGIPHEWNKVLTRFPLSGRVLNLPPRSITQANLERLASFAGEIISVQKADTAKIATKGFFTFKVWCELSKPICPGFLIPNEGRKLWLPFRYDRLPFMCFNCGFVGHDTRICAEPIKRFEDGMGNVKPGYGAWLKVDDKKVKLNLIGNEAPPTNGKVAIPSGFPKKRSNNSMASPDDNGKEIFLGPQSVVTPGKLTNTWASSCPQSKIHTFTHFDKGEAVIPNTPVLDSKTHENMISQGTLSYEGRHIKEKLIESQSKTKRNGSWRDEIETVVGNSSTPAAILPSSTDRESLIKSIFNSPINLVDVPILYDHDDACVNKVDGPSKRRKRRNKFIFQNTTMNDQFWITWAQDFLELQLGINQKLPQIRDLKPKLHWQPPQPNCLLINTDASVIEGQSGYSLSAVIRDPKGSLVIAKSEFLLGCSTVLLAEGEAILLGLKLAISRSVRQAQVASDSKTIINAIRMQNTNYADWGPLSLKSRLGPSLGSKSGFKVGVGFGSRPGVDLGAEQRPDLGPSLVLGPHPNLGLESGVRVQVVSVFEVKIWARVQVRV
ncbi:hypothetical protein G4B88_020451 [Cannabis sativa]|uniref:CCHC-type domain-containing protein n=1 Tax=Cannabis sativa TaxID=3483 RepID=A0A7J6FHF2_CANSA|nr:hypothetical protein G4B88_020451 [Cannabis sativa]